MKYPVYLFSDIPNPSKSLASDLAAPEGARDVEIVLFVTDSLSTSYAEYYKKAEVISVGRSLPSSSALRNRAIKHSELRGHFAHWEVFDGTYSFYPDETRYTGRNFTVDSLATLERYFDRYSNIAVLGVSRLRHNDNIPCTYSPLLILNGLSSKWSLSGNYSRIDFFLQLLSSGWCVTTIPNKVKFDIDSIPSSLESKKSTRESVAFRLKDSWPLYVETLESKPWKCKVKWKLFPQSLTKKKSQDSLKLFLNQNTKS